MRKRSKYRPREKIDDPVAYVLSGFKRVNDAAGDIISTVRIRNHMAINLGMEIHDAQLDACTVAQMEQATKECKR